MKKIFTSIFFFCLCSVLSAQAVLNVNGNILNTDGNPAAGVFVSLAVENIDEGLFAETDSEGNFEFAVDLGDAVQGCFELFYLDCNLEAVTIGDCFGPDNYDFSYSFIYCEGGTDTCFAILFPENTDSSVVLNVLPLGSAPFTYLWSDGSTEATLVLPPDTEGEYCVTVTDSQGCVAESCLDLTPPDPCFVWIYQEQSWNSVVLFAEGYGQTDELDYLWSTGETDNIIEVTESGEYCVTLTDGLGCESIDCQFVDIDTTGNVDCFALIYQGFDDDGTAVLYSEAFGQAPYTYAWTLGDSIISTEDFVIPEAQGTYCLTITDVTGCTFTTCYDYFVWEECGVWIGCDPLDDGSVQLLAFGYGALPIEYVWSTGDVGEELIVTENGEYCVTITDAEGCTSSTCIVVNTDVIECFVPIEVEYFDGFAELTLNFDNDLEYEVVWSDGQTGPSITVQESGFYCAEVFEVATGCSFSTCAVVFFDQGDCYGHIEVEYSDDSTAVLTAIAFNNTTDSLDLEYIWSTGEVTETITVEEEGVYCVTITSADSCVIETCVDVVFFDFPLTNSMFIAAIDESTGELLEAEVSLYTVSDDGTVELFSDGYVTSDLGLAFATDLPDGTYIVLATVEGGEYVPTYSFSTTSWEEAQMFPLNANNSIVGVEITMIPVSSLAEDDGGTIEGWVTSDNLVANGKDSESRASDPLTDANIMLMHSGIPVGHMFTDNDGNFKFSNLQYGTYQVVLEIPGLPRKIIEVTLSEDNPNATDVGFEGEDTSTSTNNISALSALTLGPNPTSGNLVIKANFTENISMMYRVVDMNGRIIMTNTYSPTIGENRIALDVSTLGNGVYNLILQTPNELMSKRFIKM